MHDFDLDRRGFQAFACFVLHADAAETLTPRLRATIRDESRGFELAN